MTTAAGLRERLGAAQAGLTRALEGVTEEQFKKRPAPSADDPAPWCIAEVLAHLLAGERLWDARIALALREDGASITPSPPQAHEDEARAGRHAPVPQLIHGLLGARRRTEQLLSLASEDTGALKTNRLWHPRLERWMDLPWMFEMIAGHFEEHRVHIEALRVAAGARPVEAAVTP